MLLLKIWKIDIVEIYSQSFRKYFQIKSETIYEIKVKSFEKKSYISKKQSQNSWEKSQTFQEKKVTNLPEMVEVG